MIKSTFECLNVTEQFDILSLVLIRFATERYTMLCKKCQAVISYGLEEMKGEVTIPKQVNVDSVKAGQCLECYTKQSANAGKVGKMNNTLTIDGVTFYKRNGVIVAGESDNHPDCGLVIENGELVDYDGYYTLPNDIKLALIKVGVVVPVTA